ncbi:hypothetical protein [Streptomyces lydicus]|uniref:hypothetical protein n=1 Tax=Streptomyces lydicus TaxID=47763 RepID=UPI0013E98BA7|nr:hypothetical protein [Streptomyces lydicus]
MPAPMRYRSTFAMYDDGAADRGHRPGAWQPKCAPAPEFRSLVWSPRPLFQRGPQ